jgi:hypothetical protein
MSDTSNLPAGPPQTTYRAFCGSCGWVSPVEQPTEDAAEDDGADHEVAMVRAEPNAPNGSHRTYVASSNLPTEEQPA